MGKEASKRKNTPKILTLLSFPGTHNRTKGEVTGPQNSEII